MPLYQNIHLFASHKGGTGKTLLSFQCACQFAKQFPDVNVLVFDLTELGDLTKRFMGHSQEALAENFGTMFELFESIDKRKGFWTRIKEKAGYDTKVDFENSTQPCLFNQEIPQNLFLVSSGVNPEQRSEYHDNMNRDDLKELALNIRQTLNQSDKSWKVFIDTDGDRRPAEFTKLGYCLADHIVIPLCPDIADFERVVAMIQTLDKLYEEIQYDAKIAMIIWNRLQLYKKDGDENGSFSITKIEQDIVEKLNNRLYALAQESDLFIHRHQKSLQEFCNHSTARVRDFPASICVPSNAAGHPFINMRAGKTQTPDGTKFQVTQDQIDASQANIDDILQRLEKMEICDN